MKPTSAIPRCKRHSPLRRCLTAALAMSVAGAIPWAGALAQTAPYPVRPIKIVVPTPPGAVTDLMARVIGKELTDALGQPVIAENKGGASGTIGTSAVAHAPKDGHTLLLAMDTHSSNQFLFKNLDYDAVNDFAPIALIGTVPMVLLAGPALPKTTFPDLIRQMKAKPGYFTYGSIGLGSQTHLPARLLETAAGVELLHVPFTGGGPMVNALLGGHVHLIFASLTTAATVAQREGVQVLAICGPRRADIFPAVPTMGELGYPDVQMSMWFGLFAPAGTPPEVVNTLSGTVGRILTTDAVHSRLTKMNLTVDYRNPVGFSKFLKEDLAQRGALIRREKIDQEVAR
jgi:tripartite-type tricarboxylate transporter receptor subunit TctC